MPRAPAPLTERPVRFAFISTTRLFLSLVLVERDGRVLYWLKPIVVTEGWVIPVSVIVSMVRPIGEHGLCPL